MLWGYEGWQYVTFAAGETVDPQRSFPRAIVFGTVLLIAIYLLANFAYLAALGSAGVMVSERVAADAVSAVLGPGAGKVIAAIILVSMFYALGGLAIFAYRRREPEMPRPFRTPGYPVTPILFVAAAAAIVVNTIVSQPGRAALGLGLVLLGIPAYYTHGARTL